MPYKPPYEKKENKDKAPYNTNAWGPPPENVTPPKQPDNDFLDSEDVNPIKVIETSLIDAPNTIKDSYTPTAQILDKNPEIHNLIEKAYNDFAEKYNIKGVSFEHFKESMKSISAISSKDTEFIRLITSKTATVVADQTILKLMVTTGKLIDRAMDLILKQAMSDASGFATNVAVISIEKIFLWMEELEKMKKKYGIIGVEQSFKNISDNHKKEENKQLSIESVRALVDKISKKEPPKNDTPPTN